MLGNGDPLFLCTLWLLLIHGRLATTRIIFNADGVRATICGAETQALLHLLDVAFLLLDRGYLEAGLRRLLISLCAIDL